MREESPSGDEQFGRGYTVGFFLFFGAIAAALACLIRSETNIARARSFAAFVAAMAGAFVFGILYQLVQGIGFSVSASLGSRHAHTTLERRRTPIWHVAFVIAVLVVAMSLLAFAGWTWLNADTVAEWISHQNRHAGD